MKPRTLKFYVSSIFSWDYTENWRDYVAIAKAYKCRFNAEAKHWIIQDLYCAQQIVRDIISTGIKPDNIICRDPATKEVVSTLAFIDPGFANRKRAAKSTIAPSLLIEAHETYIGMPLDANGRAAPEYALLYGLAVEGCRGEWVDGKGFLLRENAQFAVDYLLNLHPHENLLVRGVPKLFDEPLVCDLYDEGVVYPHQRIGVSFLTNRRTAVLADDMGLGKTMQSILAAEEALACGDCNALLIICPVSLLGNWERELRQWNCSYQDIEIVPYSRLDQLNLLDPKKKYCVIADEAHYLKNPVSQRTKSVIRFTKDAPKGVVGRLWFLTGTPVTKGSRDLWPMAHMMNHPVAEIYGPARLDGLSTNELVQLAGAMKTHMLIRKKKDTLNLPEKIRQVIDVNTNLADEMMQHLIVLARGKDALVMEHLMRLKRMTAEAKVLHTVSLAQQILSEGRKVIIFSDHKKSLHDIIAHLGKYKSVVIDGSVKPSERTRLVEDFQTKDDVMVFGGNIKAAGVGLTLTAATDVIVNDFTWLPADIQQAEDRCHRIGQTGTVNIYYLADRKLILDVILLEKLSERSSDIATFEQSTQTVMQEVKKWAKEKMTA